MQFSLDRIVDVLERTPRVLHNLVAGYPDDYLFANEGEGTWSVFDVAGHFVYIEKSNWMTRIETILSDAPDKTFRLLNPTGHQEACSGHNLEELLSSFEALRRSSLSKLAGFRLTADDFERTGIHPDLGMVTLQQLLATWTVHDLGHLAQVSRVMAKQYKAEVGPFSKYLSILNR